ncbi:MAG: peptide deformylase [Clostridia bacterium]
MATRNIVTSDYDVLYKKTRKVEKFDKKLHTLLDDMKETMELANGVGLAGPQVGILRQVCIIDVGDGIVELINPEILESSGTQDDAEGCLSFPGEYGMVERPNYVKFKAQDRDGNWYEMEGEELFARAVFHETDHLEGVVFTSKVSKMLTADELQALNEEDEK